MFRSMKQGLWGLSGPIRKPIARKIDSHLVRVMSVALHRHGEIGASDGISHGELNLLLDAMIREMTRMQAQVEDLRLALEEMRELWDPTTNMNPDAMDMDDALSDKDRNRSPYPTMDADGPALRTERLRVG